MYLFYRIQLVAVMDSVIDCFGKCNQNIAKKLFLYLQFGANGINEWLNFGNAMSNTRKDQFVSLEVRYHGVVRGSWFLLVKVHLKETVFTAPWPRLAN